MGSIRRPSDGRRTTLNLSLAAWGDPTAPSLVAQDLAKWPWPDPENVLSGPYLFGSEGNRLFPKLPTAPDEAIAWFAANGAKLKWNGSQWLLPIPQR